MIRRFTITVTFVDEALVGPGPIGPYQQVIGSRRGPTSVTLTWVKS